MSEHDWNVIFISIILFIKLLPWKCMQVHMYKHASIRILIAILKKSFMPQLQSTVFLKYFALYINNHHILFNIVQSLAYICLLLYNYHSLKRASNNVWNVLIELWLNCFNLSTALQPNHQNNFFRILYPRTWFYKRHK